MKLKGLRWWVIGLIGLATIINYIDRQTLIVLWPQIADDLFPDSDMLERKQIYSNITIVFMFSYAFGQAIFGKIFDWVGTRMGFALSIGFWSIATALHAFASSFLTFSIFRSLLGISEAGNWPGAAKANAEWFPTKERAFAQGLFNSGAAIGGIVSIPTISYLAIVLENWQAIFIIVAILGFLWLIPWFIIVKGAPKNHAWLTDEERDYILSGQKNEGSTDGQEGGYNPAGGKLFGHKQSWGVIIASAAIDPIWWLFISFIPLYLFEVFGMDVKGLLIFGWVPYVGAMLGAWFGGLLAQNRLKAGWSVDKARKLVITIGCLIMLPSLLMLANPGGPTAAVIIMAVILFGFQTAIGNIQTLPSDFFSGKTVGTLAGFAGMSAKLAAAGLIFFVPELTSGGNYQPVFVIGSGLVLLTLTSVWILCGKIEALKPKN